MIAIGGTIGTGLFLASGYTIGQAGPGGAVVSYALVGLMVYFLMTSLGEMATYMPITGSFQVYATKFVSPAMGFALGWNYWFYWATTIGVEVVAGELLMKYWFPKSPPGSWSILFLALLLVLNLLSVRSYGEAEFWFAGIKVVTVIVFIIIGIAMIFGLTGGHYYGLSNYVAYGGPFPKGLSGIIMSSFVVAFSFQGAEVVGIAAGESENPRENVPRAVNTVFWRIMLFYLGAIIVLAALVSWKKAGVLESPFTMVFSRAGIPYAAGIINLVVLTSALSCGNSGVYACTRMLYSMAKEGMAPRLFASVNGRGVPIPALITSMAMAAVSLLTNFVAANTVYIWLVSASGLAGLIAWLGIALSHYRFRQKYLADGGKLEDLKYVARFYPFGPIFAAVLCTVVIIGQAATPDSRLALYFGLPFFVVPYLYYKIRYKNNLTPQLDR